MISIEKISTLSKIELKILYQGFKLKWSKLLKICTFQEFCRLYQNTNSNESCYRVLYGGEVAGVFAISGQFSETKQIKTKKIYLSDWRWHIGMELLSDNVAKNECYISFLIIENDFQGKGLGKACLKYIEEFALKTNEISYITLFVSTNNQRAIQLYLRHGFTIDRKLKSFLTDRFIGERSWYKMKKALS